MKPTDGTRIEESGQPAAKPGEQADAKSPAQSPARHELEWHRAETERARVLVEFLSRPIHAHGGADPDPDIVVAYNLAVEAALRALRRAATSRSANPAG
jgi:hypothetical protein